VKYATLAILLCACSSGGSGGSSPAPMELDGAWVGEWRFEGESLPRVAWIEVQTLGIIVEGTGSLVGHPCAHPDLANAVDGFSNEEARTVHLELFPSAPAPLGLTLDLVLSADGQTLAGTFTIEATACAGPANGTVTLAPADNPPAVTAMHVTSSARVLVFDGLRLVEEITLIR
jgi:hypothetical protein